MTVTSETEPLAPAEYEIPLLYDNSMIADFKRCPRSFKWRHLHKRVGGSNADLIAGGAYAKGMETFRRAFWLDHKPEALAFEEGMEALRAAYGTYTPPPSKANKSLARMLEAYMGYFKRFPPAEEPFSPIIRTLEGAASIEMTFMIPVHDIKHPTGRTVLYTGRYDALVQSSTSQYVFVLDDKTTTQMGQGWAGQWAMSSQMLGYTWAAKELGYPCNGVLIRGVALTKEIRFEQTPILYPAYKLNRWYAAMCLWVQRIIDACMQDDFPEVFDFPCYAGAGCMYRELCDTTSATQQRMLQTMREYTWTPYT